MGKRLIKVGVTVLLIFFLGLGGYVAEETLLEEMAIEDKTMERNAEMITATKEGGITDVAELIIEKTDTEEEVYSEEFALSTETEYYVYTDDFNDIYVQYPQITGMEDKEKQERINVLIEDDIRALFVAEEKNELAYQHYANMHYVVKFSNENLISIFATTIDINNEKIIRLKEVVTDMDALTNMLLDDDFKNITAWDEIPGQYPLSSQLLYGGYGESAMESLREDLESSNRTDWYTDGENFVVVSHKVNRLYNEYAINIWEIQDILNEDFLGKLEAA